MIGGWGGFGGRGGAGSAGLLGFVWGRKLRKASFLFIFFAFAFPFVFYFFTFAFQFFSFYFYFSPLSFTFPSYFHFLLSTFTFHFHFLIFLFTFTFYFCSYVLLFTFYFLLFFYFLLCTFPTGHLSLFLSLRNSDEVVKNKHATAARITKEHASKTEMAKHMPKAGLGAHDHEAQIVDELARRRLLVANRDEMTTR